MLKEFIDFVDSVLPSVNPDFRDGAKEAISQFEKNGEQVKYMMISPLEHLSQGDILSNVPFCYYEDSGDQSTFVADALVLSTSCHIDHKDRLTLVPVFSLDVFEGNILDLKKNIIFDYMYIPDAFLADRFIDFEYMNSYSKKLIERAIETEKIKRIGSLNQLGYYLFIIKLTVFLMRKEDSDTLAERAVGLAY